MPKHGLGRGDALAATGGMARPSNLPHTSLASSLLARVVLVIFIAALALVPAAVPTSTTARVWQQASGYTFSVVGWHIQNLPLRLGRSLLSTEASPSIEAKLALLDRYFQDGAEVSRVQAELERLSALGAGPGLKQAQEKLDRLRCEQLALARQVEPLVQRDITDTLLAQGIGLRSFLRGRFVFPPVVIALERSPQLLVVSHRYRIDRLEDVLLVPDMAVADKDRLEEGVFRRLGLSALVEGTGGVGTYPSIVDNRSDFYYTYVAAAHEWTHNYLSLYPLGRAYFQSGVMAEVNEGVADMVGYEIADQIYRSYGREPPPRPTPASESDKRDEAAFDYNAEMRQTRITVDRLLSEGKVEEAERYMEERRQLFLKEGYYIRKLNQAYFAFHGTYASDPGSVSPVGGQLRELRQRYASLADFVWAVQGISNSGEWLALLEEKPAPAPTSLEMAPQGLHIAFVGGGM